jgi:hypothetical protein
MILSMIVIGSGFSSNCPLKGSWLRECDWDPTVSEFVAIVLGRVRLKSNRSVENTRKSASVIRDVSSTQEIAARRVTDQPHDILAEEIATAPK